MPEGTRAILPPFLVPRQLPVDPNANMHLEWNCQGDYFLHGADRKFSERFKLAGGDCKDKFVVYLK